MGLGWLVMSLWFDAYTHNPSQKKYNKIKIVVQSVLPLCVTVAVCSISLCAFWSLCVFIYTLVLYFYIH